MELKSAVFDGAGVPFVVREVGRDVIETERERAIIAHTPKDEMVIIDRFYEPVVIESLAVRPERFGEETYDLPGCVFEFGLIHLSFVSFDLRNVSGTSLQSFSALLGAGSPAVPSAKLTKSMSAPWWSDARSTRWCCANSWLVLRSPGLDTFQADVLVLDIAAR